MLRYDKYMNKKYLFLGVSLCIFISDRITKYIIANCVDLPYLVNDYISFDLVFNRGISWGIFHDSNMTVFLMVSMISAIITLLLCMHAYCVYKKGNDIFGHLCIIIGSVSNLIDRVIYGGVIDFIILSYKNYSWPIFNIADVAIVCGVGVLLFCDEI